jgi:hypothetical protein
MTIKPSADAPASLNGTSIEAAHSKLLQDPTLQFDLAHPKPPPPPPEWLHWIGDLVKSLAPVLVWVFWSGLILIVALVAWFFVREMLGLKFKRQPGKDLKDNEPEPWRPTAAQARAIIGDADALAAQGRYAEAAHLLLLRSIDDLDQRRPQAVRPALTARDIARLEQLPETARPAFAQIARVVECSLFGGVPVGAPDWTQCRQAYEDFALPAGWTR